MTAPSRDRAIERLLAVPAEGPSRDASGPCVDAEGVAAWLDGGVVGAAAEQFEAHVAACASCQELLATVIRMAPVETPVRAVPRPWTSWALPLAAAAVLVLVVWTTWPGSSRSAAPSELKEEESRMARAESPGPTAVPESPVDTPPAATPAQPAPRSAATLPPATNRSESGSPAATAAPFAASSADRLEREAAQTADTPARQTAQAKEDALDRSDRSVEQKAAAPAAPVPPAAVAETVSPRADAPEQAAAGEARARSAGNAAALAAGSPLLRDAAAARVSVQAPGAMWRWRASRVIEYSSDGGATWSPARGGPATQAGDIVAGASPAPPTVWLVGRRGLVLVAIDGMRFEVRASPAPLDLVAVQATDHLTAIVRAATGNSWRTVDGGRTWSALAR